MSRCWNIYRAIEDWHGGADPDYRGTGGRICRHPPPIPTRSHPPRPTLPAGGSRPSKIRTAAMMEGDGGASILICGPVMDTAIGLSFLRFPLHGPAN